MVIKVGCCGYPVSRKKYYENFDTVELNVTFYRYPNEALLEKWRKEAPVDFEFTVKAHQEISHDQKLKLNDECIKALDQMKHICNKLRSQILLIQTPSSIKPSAEIFRRVEDFFSKAETEGLIIAWETRGPLWEDETVRKKLGELLSRLNITHVSDPLKMLPVYTGDIAYFRLHGLGERMYYYQFTDNELAILYDRIKGFEDSKTVYVFFNNLSMFDDAKRFLQYIRTRKFPKMFDNPGPEAVKKLIEKAGYPISKTLLSKFYGWKIVVWKEGKQVQFMEILKHLPERKYNSADDVLKELARMNI